ncbi:MAG: hypothetical protein AAF902_02945 [Chloroflexota bacterium]
MSRESTEEENLRKELMELQQRNAVHISQMYPRSEGEMFKSVEIKMSPDGICYLVEAIEYIEQT